MIARSASVMVWAKAGRGAMSRRTKVGMQRTLQPRIRQKVTESDRRYRHALLLQCPASTTTATYALTKRCLYQHELACGGAASEPPCLAHPGGRGRLPQAPMNAKPQARKSGSAGRAARRAASPAVMMPAEIMGLAR